MHQILELCCHSVPGVSFTRVCVVFFFFLFLFVSLRLSLAERNYDIGDQQLLAIKLALEKWRY